MKPGTPITVRLSKDTYPPQGLIIEWEIIKTRNHPTFGTCWNVCTECKETLPGTYNISLRKLNTSRWWIIRKIQLWSIRKLLNK